MSSNNEIYIIKNINGSYSVYDRDVDVPDEERSYSIGLANDLETAINMANEYMIENEVEYGLHIELTSAETKKGGENL